MANILFSFLILLIFSINGYWLYSILGRPGRTILASFVLSAWAGVISLLLISTNLYSLFKNIPAHILAFPIVICFACISIIAFFIHRQKPEKLRFNWSIFLVVLVSFSAIVFISLPFFEKTSLVVFYSNNGEYANYILISDFVQHYGYNATPSFFNFTTHSRECVVGLLGSIFSTIFYKSAIFIIQPLSYAFAWLSFLSLGAILLELEQIKTPDSWLRGVMLSVFIAAIFSSANFQFWTMSFLSHYLNQTLILGAILFFISILTEYKTNIFRNSFFLGLFFVTTGCAYPEQIIPTAIIVMGMFLLFSPNFSFETLKRRITAIIVAVIITPIVGNVFFYNIMYVYMNFFKAVALIPNSSGWDIYGPTAKPLTLVSNFFGLSNIFLINISASKIAFFCLISLLLLALLISIFIIFSKKTDFSKTIPMLFVGYTVVSIFFLWFLHYRHYPSNYIAVKFIVGWIWIAYIGMGYAIGTIRSDLSKYIVTILGLILLIAAVEQSYIYVYNMRQNSRETLFSESEMIQINNLTKGEIPLIISTTSAAPGMPIFNLYGSLMILKNNFWPKLLNVPNNNRIIGVLEKTADMGAYSNFSFLLIIGPGHAEWGLSKNNASMFKTIYMGNSFNLLKK
ncbi:MAG: hypothetical protein A2X12_02200 [Bacteroidetes bacterium GWE2_29_8]|nr:MAG: hypothetical protein A2X12_02200 [Bacteroidetes bacterium GWE2_29_8]